MPRKKATKKTHIVYVIDRSASMASVWQAALDGLNENLNSVRMNNDLGGETDVSIVAFDSEVDTILVGMPADMTAEVTAEEIFPRGTTALYDAISTAIELITDKKETKDTGYLVTVISDGYENASTTTTQKELSAQIKALEATGKWTFTFMLANQDIHVFADSLGVSAGNMASWKSTPAGTQDAFIRMSVANVGYLSARNVGATQTLDTYSPQSTPPLPS